MKRLYLFFTAAALLFQTTTYGDEQLIAANNTTSSLKNTQTSSENLSCLYNSSGRIDVKGSWDLFITGSYIYWQPREAGLELAYLWQFTTPSNEWTVYNMDFDYKSGFKVGLGGSFCSDNWVAYLDYTRLHTTDHRSISSPDTAILQSLWNTLSWAGSVSSTWKLRYDMLDLKLSRPFYEGSCLTADSFLGMKGGWIKQQYQSKEFYYELGHPEYSTTASSKSWLVGPQIGVNMNYLLGAGFRFFGDSDVALLFQNAKTTIRVPVVYTGLDLLNEKSSYNQLTPNFDLDAGLGWGTYFDNNNWHFDLSAAYEFQYYWKQNFMKELFDQTNPLFSGPVSSSRKGKTKDLVLHGLTITGRFDF